MGNANSRSIFSGDAPAMPLLTLTSGKKNQASLENNIYRI